MFLLNEDKTILSDGMSNEGMEVNVSVYIDFNSGKMAELNSFPTRVPSSIPIKKKIVTVWHMRGILPVRIFIEEFFFI